MHERRGDVISRPSKRRFKKPSGMPPGRPLILAKDPARAPLRSIRPSSNVGAIDVATGNFSDNPNSVTGKVTSSSSEQMTNSRFTIAEKLRNIDNLPNYAI